MQQVSAARERGKGVFERNTLRICDRQTTCHEVDLVYDLDCDHFCTGHYLTVCQTKSRDLGLLILIFAYIQLLIFLRFTVPQTILQLHDFVRLEFNSYEPGLALLILILYASYINYIYLIKVSVPTLQTVLSVTARTEVQQKARRIIVNSAILS